MAPTGAPAVAHHQSAAAESQQQRRVSKGGARNLVRAFSSPATEAALSAKDGFDGGAINAASLRQALLMTRFKDSVHRAIDNNHKSSNNVDHKPTRATTEAAVEEIHPVCVSCLDGLDEPHNNPTLMKSHPEKCQAERDSRRRRNSSVSSPNRDDGFCHSGDAAANVSGGNMLEQSEAAEEEETGQLLRISDCFVDPHRASYLVGQLNHGVLFYNGKIAVLSGFIPAGVLCRNIGRELQSASMNNSRLSGSWCPLFQGRVFPADIIMPPPFDQQENDNSQLSSSGCALIMDIGNVGNLVRAASTIIPCAHLRVSSPSSSQDSLEESSHQQGLKGKRLVNAFEYQGALLSGNPNQHSDEVALYHDMWCLVE